MYELTHHGVKGQEWGVQNGPPYPLTPQKKKLIKKVKAQGKEKYDAQSTRATSIPKGSILYRTVTSEDEDESGSKYVTYYQGDRAFYKGQGADWIASVNRKKFNELREKQYTLKEDLNIPSRETVKSIYVNKILKDNKAVVEAGKSFVEARLMNNYGLSDSNIKDLHSGYDKGMEYVKKLQKGTVEEQNASRWQDYYNNYTKNTLDTIKNGNLDNSLFTFSGSYGRSEYTKQKMISELQKAGYNAMTDEYGVGGHDGFTRETRQALIVFNGDDVFDKSKTKTSRISESDYRKSLQKYSKFKRTDLAYIDALKRQS